MHPSHLAAVLLSASLLTLLSPPPQPVAAALQQPVELELAPYAGHLRTVQGRIGAFAGTFLFDSGGGGTVLSEGTARSVGCTPFGRATGFRHDGQRIDGRRGTPIDLALGDYRRVGEVGVLDLGALLQGLPPVAGIVSLETFAGQTLTMDLRHERLVVETAASLEQRTKDARPLQVRIGRQAAGAALDLVGAIDGAHGPLWFELDCGNLAPVLIAPHAFVELGIDAPRGDAVREVRLPVHGLGPVACKVAAKELIYDGLLNAEFCREHVLTLDLAAGRGWATP